MNKNEYFIKVYKNMTSNNDVIYMYLTCHFCEH